MSKKVCHYLFNTIYFMRIIDCKTNTMQGNRLFYMLQGILLGNMQKSPLPKTTTNIITVKKAKTIL